MSFNFFNIAYSRYLFKKSDFSRFLVYASKNQIDQNKAWVCFKLGMYSTVNALPLEQAHTRNELLAYAASAAACDDLNRLTIVTTKFESDHHEQIKDLIEVITPFHSDLALELALKYKIKSPHAVALMIRNHQYLKAERLLNYLFKNKKKNLSELLLLRAQIQFHKAPSSVLSEINQIYSNINLIPLSLKNSHNPVNVNNITTFLPTKSSASNQSKLISILVTTFNCENYLKSTLDSLIQQTYKNIEIIVVDDKSTDTTWKILQSYTAKDQRIRIYQQPINLGTYIAKNRAFCLARGEFIICHDSDDWSHPQRLDVQIKPLLDNKNLIATTSEWFRLSDEGQVYARSIFPISRLNPSSPLFRRKPVMQKLGFWDSVRTGADSEFLARLKLIFGKKAVQKIKIPLAIGSHHSSSLMNAPETGFISQSIPYSRLQYWESWSAWHLKAMRNKQSLYLPLNALSEQRKFNVPDSIAISDQLLLKYQNQIGTQN